MTPFSGGPTEHPVRVVSLVEVFDIFAAYMRRGVADLIERGDFAQPYQELIGLTVWDRDDVECWITDHPEVGQTSSHCHGDALRTCRTPAKR